MSVADEDEGEGKGEDGAPRPDSELVVETDDEEPDAEGLDAAPPVMARSASAVSLRFEAVADDPYADDFEASPRRRASVDSAASLWLMQNSQHSASSCGLSLKDALGLIEGLDSSLTTVTSAAGGEGVHNHLQPPSHWEEMVGSAGNMMEVPLATDSGSIIEFPLGEAGLNLSAHSKSTNEFDDTYNLSRRFDISSQSGILTLQSAVSGISSSNEGIDDSYAESVDVTGWGIQDGDDKSPPVLPTEEGEAVTKGKTAPVTQRVRGRWCIVISVAALTLFGAAEYLMAEENGLVGGTQLLTLIGGFLGNGQRDLLEEEDSIRQRRRFERAEARREERRRARAAQHTRRLRREEALREAVEVAARSEEWRALIREGHGGGVYDSDGHRGLGLSVEGLSEQEWNYHIEQWEAIERALRLEELRPLIRGS